MTKPIIEFNINYNNKLNCKGFIVIMLWDENRYTIGQQYEIFLDSEYLFMAQVISFTKRKISGITKEMALMDSGYTKTEFEKMMQTRYRKKEVDIYSADFAVMFLQRI